MSHSVTVPVWVWLDPKHGAAGERWECLAPYQLEYVVSLSRWERMLRLYLPPEDRYYVEMLTSGHYLYRSPFPGLRLGELLELAVRRSVALGFGVTWESLGGGLAALVREPAEAVEAEFVLAGLHD